MERTIVLVVIVAHIKYKGFTNEFFCCCNMAKQAVDRDQMDITGVSKVEGDYSWFLSRLAKLLRVNERNTEKNPYGICVRGRGKETGREDSCDSIPSCHHSGSLTKKHPHPCSPCTDAWELFLCYLTHKRDCAGIIKSILKQADYICLFGWVQLITWVLKSR